MQTLLDTFSEEIGSQQDQNLFPDDKEVQKKLKLKLNSNYSNTKIKTRNLLTNVSYRGYKQKDFTNASFIIGILSFIVQNFNPIRLERKLEIENERKYIKMMWDICQSHVFTRFIYLKDNYTVLSSPNLTYQKANNIVKRFIEQDIKNIDVLRAKIQENFKIIHYIHSLLYPKIYNRITE